MAQWLIEGLTATISGVATVFIVLILIALIIASLQYVINPKKTIERMREQRAAKAKAREAELNKTTESIMGVSDKVSAVPAPSQAQDDLELVAAITAAIAASLDVSSDRLVVRSIRRVNHRTGWTNR